MGHHFVIGEFVVLCHLNDAVEDQDVAVLGGAKDENGLVVRVGGVEDAAGVLLFEGQTEALAGPHGVGFREPAMAIDTEGGVFVGSSGSVVVGVAVHVAMGVGGDKDVVIYVLLYCQTNESVWHQCGIQRYDRTTDRRMDL